MRLKQINKYLIALYFFVCPVEIALNIIFTSTAKYIGMLVLGSWLACILYEKHNNGQSVISYHVISVFIWLAYCLFSLAWDNESIYTTEYLTTYLQMGLLLFACTFEIWKKSDILLFLRAYWFGSILMALAMVLFGGYEYSGRGTVQIYDKYCDANQVAANIVPGILISYYNFFRIDNKPPVRFVSAAGFLLSIYSLLLTSSRGGFVAVVAGVLMISIMQTRAHAFSTKRFIVLIVASAVIMFSLPLASRQRLLNLDSYTDTYSDGGNRLTIWAHLFEDYDAQWIVGHGVGSTITALIKATGHECGVHNTFLLALYEVGIVGFVFFIYPYFSLVYYHFRNNNAVPVALLVGAMISSFLLDALNLRYLWNGLIVCIMQYNYEASLPQEEGIGNKTYRYIR